MNGLVVLGWIGLGWVVSGLFFWGWVFYWVGLAQGGLGLGWGDASRYPCSPTQLATASYSNDRGGLAKHLQLFNHSFPLTKPFKQP